MIKYYTRACNFFYGKKAEKLILQNKALPLNASKNFAFDTIEIIKRNNKKVNFKIIKTSEIKKLSKNILKNVNKDLKRICKKKIFLRQNCSKGPFLIGILNITPDSFSDGGLFFNKRKAINHAKFLINSGSNVIDIGGESTRPGSKVIGEKNEWQRISNVLKVVRKKYPKINISLDTRKSSIMEKGLKNKINIINDVSGLNFDKKSINIISKYKVAFILHHMQGTPQKMQINPKYNNVLLDIYDFFESKIKILNNNGIKNIILDPGIGFGKNLKHNLMLMSRISLFHSLGFPLMIGTSRKRFINQISGNYDSKERIGGTLSSVLYTYSQGVQVFRVHNVKEVKQGILVFKKLLFE